jgi:tetratricopeptide (TPR) repeat protein
MARERDFVTGAVDQTRWEKIAVLFERATALPASEHDGFIRRETGDDFVLADTVLRMLRHDATEQVLDTSVDDLAALLFDDDDEQPLGAGDRVGDYEILDVLGRGGMGIVYKARDTRLDRLAALKFLPPTAASSGATARVEAEARAASALDHPNIATIYHVGTGSDARPYIAMAHYEGQTLAERLRSGPVTTREAVQIAAAVAGGLAAAHERGIVHRDVKPSNILLTDTGQVKLLDFGIAAASGGESDRPGYGTPLYMSPEQDRSVAPHPQSDVWSLGTVLYEMLAGRTPFEGASAADVRALKAGELPPLPRRPGITKGLRTIVARSLSRDPGHRYANAGVMHGELERILHASRVRPARLIRIVLAAASIGGVAIAFRLTTRDSTAISSAPSPSVLAIFPFQVAGDSAYAYLREGMVDLLSAAFDGVGGMRSVDARAIRSSIDGIDSIVRDPERGAVVATKLGAGRFILGEISGDDGRLRALATLYDHRGRLVNSAGADVASEERLFEIVDRLSNQLLGQQVGRAGASIRRLAAATTSSLTALKAFLDGERALRTGAFEVAASAFANAVAIDTGFALAYYGLANAAWWAERTESARVPALRALRGADGLPRFTRLLLQGLVARLDGDLDGAEAIYRQLITLAPDAPDAWFGLADVLFHYNAFRGRSPQEAKPFFEHALVLQPDNMTFRLHLANIAARRREYARHDSLLTGLPRSAEFARFVRMVNAFARDDSTEQSRTISELRGVPSKRLGEALHYIIRLSHNPRAAFRFVELLERPGRSRADRGTGRLYRAGLELTLGRWNAAVRDLLAADSLGDVSALPTLALWSLAPFLPADTARWRDFLGRLADRHEGEDRRKVTEYLRGLLSVRLGDTATARRLAERLASAPNDTSRLSGRRLALAIRAELAVRAGDPGEGLRLLELIQPSPTIDLLQDPVLNQSYERFLRAELLRDAGRNDEALAWYEGLIDGPTLESIHIAPAYHRSAQLLRLAGDSAGAAAAERSFRGLWLDADAALRSWSTPAGQSPRL